MTSFALSAFDADSLPRRPDGAPGQECPPVSVTQSRTEAPAAQPMESTARKPAVAVRVSHDETFEVKPAEHDLMSRVVTSLGQASSLLTIQCADHGFDVLVLSGRKHVEVMAELLDGFARWTGAVLQARHEVRLRHGKSIPHCLGLSSRMALVSALFEVQ